MKENKFICHIDNSNEYTRSQKYANGWKYSYIDYFYTKNLETDQIKINENAGTSDHRILTM